MQETNDDFYDMSAIAKSHIYLKNEFRNETLPQLIQGAYKDAATKLNEGKRDYDKNAVANCLLITYNYNFFEEKPINAKQHIFYRDDLPLIGLPNKYSLSYMINIFDQLFTPKKRITKKITRGEVSINTSDYVANEPYIKVKYTFTIDSCEYLENIIERFDRIIEAKESALQEILDKWYAGLSIEEIAKFQSAEYFSYSHKKPRPEYVEPNTGYVRGIIDRKPIEDHRKVLKP